MDDHDDEGHGEIMTLMADNWVLVAGVFLLLVVAMVANLAEKVKQTAQEGRASVIVEAFWPDDKDCDVDLWVRGPDGVPVGYSNKSSTLYNLDRDDLGYPNDISGENFEVARSRGITPGSYVVNLHYYRDRAKAPELPVKVVVTVRDKQGASRQILYQNVTLKGQGTERTVFTFSLDAMGSLVPDSVSTVQRNLRAAGSS